MDVQLKKQCAYCGTEFFTNNPKKKYCSSTCRTYASLERKGKLPPAQQEIRKKMQESASIGGTVNMTDSAKELSPGEPFESRNSFFANFLTGELYRIIEEETVHRERENVKTGMTSVRKEKKYDTGLMTQDYLYNLERARITSKGNFIVCSTSKEVIQTLQGIYQGSEVFAIPVQINREKFYELEGKDAYIYHPMGTAYCTIITKEDILNQRPYLEKY